MALEQLLWILAGIAMIPLYVGCVMLMTIGAKKEKLAQNFIFAGFAALLIIGSAALILTGDLTTKGWVAFLYANSVIFLPVVCGIQPRRLLLISSRSRGSGRSVGVAFTSSQYRH